MIRPVPRLGLAVVSAAALGALALRVGDLPSRGAAPAWSVSCPGGRFSLLLPPDSAVRRLEWPQGGFEAIHGEEPDTILFSPSGPPTGLRGGRRTGHGFGVPPARGCFLHGFGASLHGPAPRILPLEDFRFEDRFMREEPGTEWRVIRGRWELRGLSDPDRSVNPFSVVADFRTAHTPPGFLERRKGRRDPTGLGLLVRMNRVARVLPGKPAHLAGIRAGDLIAAVDGTPIPDGEPAMRALAGEPGSEVTVRLGAGESARELRLTRATVYWSDLEWRIPFPSGDASGPAILAAGPALSRDLSLRTTARPEEEGGAMGLAFDVLGSDRWSAARWRAGADGRGRLEIVRSVGGRITSLAGREMGFLPGQHYRLGLDLVGERITVSVDGARVLDARDAGRGAGAFGLYAEGPGACSFDDVQASSAALADGAAGPSLSDVFVRDRFMEEWADPAQEWGEADGEGFRVWRPGRPRTLRVCLPASPTPTEVRIDAGGASASFRQAPGRPLEIEADGQGAREIREAVPGGAGAVPLPAGPRAVRVRGLSSALLSRARVVSAGMIDSTFDEAPWEWEVRGGEWDMMNRWVCDPRWSWFGGWGRGVAAIWGLRPIGGDFAVDVYASPLMLGLGKGERPGDVNLTVLGDGASLASGYTLILGGGGNRWSRLYRRDEILWESRAPEDLVPTGAGPLGKSWLHKYWFHLRIERDGPWVSASLNDRPLARVRDPDPLPDGRLAIWTRNNGILVARVRILADRIGAPGIPVRGPGEPDGTLAERRFEADGDAGEVRALRTGADLACPFGRRLFDARALPIVSFTGRFSPGTVADLRFVCRGRPFRIRLTGPARALEDVETLGEVPATAADGTERPISIDLGAILARRFADGRPLFIRDLEIRRTLDESYADAGFGIGGAQEGYSVRRFRHATRDEAPRADARPLP